MLHTSYAYMPASAPSTSHKVLTKVDTDGAWRRSYTDHMAYEARRRRKGAWGLKCEMREDGIRTERGEGQLYGQKKDVNAWKIRRNKLWSASLAMAMEEREEASGKKLHVRTASVLWWAERCFFSTLPSSSLAVPLSPALPFRMR